MGRGREDVGRLYYPCKIKTNNDSGTAASGALLRAMGGGGDRGHAKRDAQPSRVL